MFSAHSSLYPQASQSQRLKLPCGLTRPSEKRWLTDGWCVTTGSATPVADSPGTRNVSITQSFRPPHLGHRCVRFTRGTLPRYRRQMSVLREMLIGSR